MTEERCFGPGDVTEIALKVKQLFKQHVLSSQLANMSRIDIDTYVHAMTKDLIITLSAEIATQTLFQRICPVNWWEAFRERWFPNWWIKRHPIVYDVFTAEAFFPDLAFPKGQHYIHVFKHRGLEGVCEE